MKNILVVLAAVALVAPAAVADDLNPPEWRGDSSTTWQEWTFDGPSGELNLIYPEDFENPYYDPENPMNGPAIVDDYWDPTGGDSEWYDTFEGRDGVYRPYWYFYIDVPNDPEPRPLKEIYLQMTWHPSGDTPVISLFWPEVPFTSEVNLDMRYELDDGWMYDRWHILIQPNPDWESMYVDLESWDYLYIDQIVVDTICFPEPASLALLAVGGLILIRRKK